MRPKGNTALGGLAIVAIAGLLAWPAFDAAGQGSAPPDGLSGASNHKPLDMPHAVQAPGDRSPLDRLKAAYGDFIAGTEESDGATIVVMKDGTRLPWDDGVVDMSFETRLARPDLEDMFYCPYPKGEMESPPDEEMDPGRVRVFDFFASVYGGSPKEVRASLVEVPWLPSRGGRPVKFNSKNGAADALSRASAELEALPETLMRYVVHSSGTYSWRRIAGTRRQSAHGFGIAIDIDARRADYWRWGRRALGLVVYRNRVPREIVDVFERNGFIWGGKWYHYDTMHFEYRPELL